MSSDIRNMKAVEIIAAIREPDMEVVKALTHYMVTKKKYMTVRQMQEVLEDYGIKRSHVTIWRWVTGNK